MKLKLTQDKGEELLGLLRKREAPVKLTFESESGKVEIEVFIKDVKISFPPNKPDLASIDLDVIEFISTNNSIKV